MHLDIHRRKYIANNNVPIIKCNSFFMIELFYMCKKFHSRTAAFA